MGTPTLTAQLLCSGSTADTFEGTTPVMLAPVLVLAPVLSSVLGGCSFKDHLGPTFSKIHDLDQAKYAAKMALAHQGLDIETLKKRQASMDNETAKRREEQKTNSETYIPTYVTSHDEETKPKEKVVQNLDEFEGDIWELADRSNKKYNSRYPRKEGDLDKIEL